jgi:hypothetical protein
MDNTGLCQDRSLLKKMLYPSPHMKTETNTVCPQSQFWVLKNCIVIQIELVTCGLRQIRAKLWNFFLTPKEGMSGHLYVSHWVVCEMATVQERARCVGWLYETKSVTQTQRNYSTQFRKQPPSDNAIRSGNGGFYIRLLNVTIVG